MCRGKAKARLEIRGTERRHSVEKKGRGEERKGDKRTNVRAKENRSSA